MTGGKVGPTAGCGAAGSGARVVVTEVWFVGRGAGVTGTDCFVTAGGSIVRTTGWDGGSGTWAAATGAGAAGTDCLSTGVSTDGAVGAGGSGAWGAAAGG